MNEPSESAVPGLAGLATWAPFWSSVTESPAPAPVSQASSTEPFACKLEETVAAACGAQAASAGAIPMQATASPAEASLLKLRCLALTRFPLDPVQ